MNTTDLEQFNEWEEPALGGLVIAFVRRYRRLPTGEELIGVADAVLRRP